MRILSDRIHGVIDYAAAIVLIVMPLITNFEAVSPVAHWLSIAAGLALLLYSLGTSYTYSAAGIISFGFHLALDFAAGLVFLAAPFAFGFGGVPRVFYLAAGAAVVLLVLFTDPKVEPGSDVSSIPVSDSLIEEDPSGGRDEEKATSQDSERRADNPVEQDVTEGKSD